MLARCRDLEATLRPALDGMLSTFTVAELRQLAKTIGAFTRGCTVRAHYERAIEKVWRAEVWDIAGYRSPSGGRPARRLLPKEIV